MKGESAIFAILPKSLCQYTPPHSGAQVGAVCSFFTSDPVFLDGLWRRGGGSIPGIE